MREIICSLWDKTIGVSRRLSRRGAVLAIGVVLLSGHGCGGSPSLSTPKATFEAMQNAKRDGDWEVLCRCLTPESRDRLANQLVQGAFEYQLMSADADKEKVEAIFKKHGIVMSGEFSANRERLVAGVEDKNQLIADLAEFMKDLESDAEPEPSTLKDVEISGDTATAKVTVKIFGETTQVLWKFKRIGGEWKSDQ